jgi:hypothetical protein
MRQILHYFYAFVFGIAIIPNLVNGQVVTTIGTIPNACVGDTITVPVNVVMSPGITVAAISMAIDYDTTKLQCLMTGSGAAAQAAQNINPAIANGFLSNVTSFANLNPNPPYNGSTRRQVRAAWFNLSPVGFSGLMFNLRFIVLNAVSSSSALKWDLSTAGNCEYADEFADVIPVPASGWVNGALSAAGSLASISGTINGNLNITAGDNTNLSIGASNAVSYQWQVLSPGSSWTNVSNTTPFSGATTSTLTITSVPASLNGSQFRVLVGGSCGNPVTSNAVSLVVTSANSIGFSAANFTGCQGDTASIPLNVNGLTAVTAMSLVLDLPVGASYVGLNGFAAGLTGVTGNVSGNTLSISWAGTSFSLASGTLMNVRVVLPALSSVIAWNNSSSVTPNATLGFTSGSISVTPLPVINTPPPTSLTVGEFASATLSVVATNASQFQWQRQALNGSWVDLQNGTQYAGTNTPILSIPSASVSMNNFRYRVRILNGSCPGAVISPTCTLNVTPMSITLNAVGATACAGDTVLVPVRVSGASNIANMNIYLQYNSSNLQYLGFDSALNTGILITSQNTPTSRISIAYSGSNAISLNQTTVARLRFRAFGTSNLSWSSNSEFNNSIGDSILPSQINGVSSQVVVTSAQVTAAGPTSFCVGGSVVLNGNTITGATYQWFNGSTVIAGATNASYTASSSGSYRFFLALAGGCSDTSSPVLVTTSVPPTATITPSGATTFCQGQSVGLVATRGTGFTYRWYRDNVRISSVAPNADSIGALLSGTYRVVVINSANCADSFATGVVVTAKPRPRAPQISRPTVPPASDTLFANIRNQNNITWYRNGVAQTGGADGALRITGNGIYRAIQDSNGCRSDSSNAIIVTGVGVFENSVNTLNVQLYPNPTNGLVVLSGEFDTRASSTKVAVSNLAGQILGLYQIDGLQGNFRHELNLEGFAPGVYLMTISRGEQYSTLRFVRE